MFGEGSWTELASELHFWWIDGKEKVPKLTSFILHWADCWAQARQVGSRRPVLPDADLFMQACLTQVWASRVGDTVKSQIVMQ